MSFFSKDAGYGSIEAYELRNAWYYFTLLPDESGLLTFGSSIPHVHTNWPTLGVVPRGRHFEIRRIRLQGGDALGKEMHNPSGLKLRVANRDFIVHLPSFLLAKGKEVDLFMPIRLEECVPFYFSLYVEKKERPLTLWMSGVDQLRR